MFTNNHIRLRKVEPEDLPWLYLCENDAEAWQSGDTHNPLSQKDLRDYIESSTGDIYKDGQLRMMIVGSEGETLGCVDLYDFDPHNCKAAVGIYVDPHCRQQGVGQSALKLLEDYAFSFLHLRMLYSLTASDNKKSTRLFSTCGWQQTSVLKDWLLSGDVLLYQRFTPLQPE